MLQDQQYYHCWSGGYTHSHGNIPPHYREECCKMAAEAMLMHEDTKKQNSVHKQDWPTYEGLGQIMISLQCPVIRLLLPSTITKSSWDLWTSTNCTVRTHIQRIRGTPINMHCYTRATTTIKWNGSVSNCSDKYQYEEPETVPSN